MSVPFVFIVMDRREWLLLIINGMLVWFMLMRNAIKLNNAICINLEILRLCRKFKTAKFHFELIRDTGNIIKKILSTFPKPVNEILLFIAD